jgi:hypothetical protein
MVGKRAQARLKQSAVVASPIEAVHGDLTSAVLKKVTIVN